MIAAAWLAACTNLAPSLLSLNGQPPLDESVDQGLVALYAPIGPGGVLPIEVEAEDPEGDPFEVWFPATAGVIDFSPDARRGTWTAPIDRVPDSLELLLRDRADPKASRLYLVLVDTGGSGG